MVEVLYSDNDDTLFDGVLEQLEGEINAMAKSKDNIVIAIPGGRSVQPLWERLLDAEVAWEKVQIFLADERIVEPTHEDSNYKLAHDMFLRELIEDGDLPAENVHIFTPGQGADKGSGEYNAEFLNFGGRVDILLLGVGEDGHVGALYPNHHSIQNEESGYIIMDDSPKDPPNRMSLSKKTMMSAPVVFGFFIGEGKRESLTKCMQEGSLEECPARILRKVPRGYIVTNLAQ